MLAERSVQDHQFLLGELEGDFIGVLHDGCLLDLKVCGFPRRLSAFRPGATGPSSGGLIQKLFRVGTFRPPVEVEQEVCALAHLRQRAPYALLAVDLAQQDVVDVVECAVVEPVENVHAGVQTQFCHVRVLLDLEAGQFVQTIPQENLTEASGLLAMLLMFIGGSPSGTAGGVKTVTIAVLILSTIATVRGEHEVTAFRRKITDNFVRRAAAVVSISFGVLVLVCTVLTITESADFTDVLFESVSAIATVGLTRGLTPNLTVIGKITIITAMYLGRLGPITMALAFNSKKYEGKKSLAEGKIMIG